MSKTYYAKAYLDRARDCIKSDYNLTDNKEQTLKR